MERKSFFTMKPFLKKARDKTNIEIYKKMFDLLASERRSIQQGLQSNERHPPI